MSLLQNIGWYGLNKLQVWELNEQGDLLSILSVRKASNQLQIESYQLAPPFPDQLSSHIPILLALRLENKMEAQIETNQLDIVAALLGVEIDDKSDFVWQANPINQGKQWACLVRRQGLESIMQRIAPISKQIIYVNLSMQSLQILIPSYWEEDEHTLSGSMNALSERLGTVEQALYPYSVAMQYFRQSGQDLHGLEWDLGIANRFQLTAKWFKSLSLLSSISLLLMSSLWFGQTLLASRLAERQDFITQSTASLQKLASLQSQLAEKEDYLSLNQKGFEASRISFWLDRTASLSPTDLQFDRWYYQPAIADCKKLGYDANEAPMLLIKGAAQSAASISAFAQGVQSQSPQYTVQLHQSQYDLQQQRYQFLLILL